MATRWEQQKDRGGYLALKLLSWFGLRLGRGFARVLCLPIAAWFTVTAGQPKQASRQILERVLERPVTWRDYFRHFYTFAMVSVDRFHFLAGKGHRFQLDFHGEQALLDSARQGQGCILLVSHFGSFDAMRVPGIEDENIPIRILMDLKHNENVARVLGALNPELASGIIDASRAPQELVLALDSSLQKGEMVGIMADRASAGEKVLAVDFLGQPANFPAGPWYMAMVLQVPVYLCFAMYRGGNRYSVHFEPVALNPNVRRKDRARQVELYVEQYAARLESYVKREPYNWFNFYDFWADATSKNN